MEQDLKSEAPESAAGTSLPATAPRVGWTSRLAAGFVSVGIFAAVVAAAWLTLISPRIESLESARAEATDRYLDAESNLAATGHELYRLRSIMAYSEAYRIPADLAAGIRENFRKMRKGTPESVMNSSINQTLSRTLMTSLTTLLVLLALFFLGGEIIHSFALALIVGVFVGTYSSIFIACSSTLALGVSKADLMPVEKEGKEVDDQP